MAVLKREDEEDDWDEDDDGNLIPVAEPEPERVYDLARINRALTLAVAEPDETGD